MSATAIAELEQLKAEWTTANAKLRALEKECKVIEKKLRDAKKEWKATDIDFWDTFEESTNARFSPTATVEGKVAQPIRVAIAGCAVSPPLQTKNDCAQPSL